MNTIDEAFNSEVRTVYSSKASSLDAIESLIIKATPEAVATFDWEREAIREAERLSEMGADRGHVVISLLKAMHQSSHLNLILMIKVSGLARLLVYALNTNNLVGLGLAARSLLEHSASTAYLYHETQKLKDTLSNQHEEDRAKTQIENFINKLEKMYFGTGYFEIEYKKTSPVHVNKLLKSLGNDISDLDRKYAYLCDFVHPNLGTNLLVSDGGLGVGAVEPNPETVRTLVGGILELCADMARYLTDRRMDVSTIVMFDLRRMCDDLLANQKPLHDTLSGRQKNYFSGSGNSAEDPIRFHEVSTHAQYFSALRRFIDDYSIDPEARNLQKGGNEGRERFDVYTKDNEEIWILVNYTIS